MTRTFWAFIMLFSLGLTGFSGYYLYTGLQARENTVTVPLQQVPETPRTEPVAVSTQTAQVETVAPLPAEKSVPEKKPSDSGSAKRNILFTYKNPNAKEVFLIGEFNEWFREPMKKKQKGVWNISMKISPGTYEYLFVVDGKRTKDPNNKKSTPDGKSLITVKSLPKSS